LQNDTLNAPYNNLDAVKQLVEEHKGEIAAIIIEPVARQYGLYPSRPRLPGRLEKIM
jgi:glutamate-1-semialdehyde 2,1-aminomutase